MVKVNRAYCSATPPLALRGRPTDKKLLFVAIVQQEPKIQWARFVADADGSNVVQLADSGDVMEWLAWSPDGEHIASDDGKSIFLINKDGSKPRQLTHDAN